MVRFAGSSTITAMGSATASTARDVSAQLPSDSTALAVLTSGGLDSAILLAQALDHYAAVHPLYVRSGLVWETAERAHLRSFLERIRRPALRPLEVLDEPIGDIYGNHWSVTGRDVPDAESPDQAVFLPGRNVLLLAKTLLWCHLHRVPAVALATLHNNPFPDATGTFFTAYQEIVNQAIGGNVRVVCPFAGLRKAEVMHLGRDLPLELTFSCIHPVAGRHCGRCNKCAERHRAFVAAGLADATDYDRQKGDSPVEVR
jgi:7-cyano-7-deazaguanine synthase